MKRFALIVEASEVPGEDKLPGAAADALNYYEWLYSKSGGDWFGSEIVVLHTPTVAQVKKAVSDAGKVDYAFVAFSGHGFHHGELDETQVCLRGGFMSARRLMPNADRCAVVVDACRHVLGEEVRESIKLSATINKAFPYADRDYRKDFENEMSRAEKGSVFLFSCDLDEAAGEGNRGGYFSRSLYRIGVNFRNSNTKGTNWLPMDKAFRRAAEMTRTRNPQQNPRFQTGSRSKHFPFAV